MGSSSIVGVLILFGLLYWAYARLQLRKKKAAAIREADEEFAQHLRDKRTQAPAETERPAAVSSPDPSRSRIARASTPSSKPLEGRWVTPMLTEIPEQLAKVYKVKSFSEKGVVYDLDLKEMTCTCPDFYKRREEHPARSPFRACKHLAAILRENGVLGVQEAYVRYLMEDHHEPPRYFLELDQPQGKIVIGLTPGKEWVEVFAPKRTKSGPGDVERFGYNVERKNWSYGMPPFGPIPIKKVIHAQMAALSA